MQHTLLVAEGVEVLTRTANSAPPGRGLGTRPNSPGPRPDGGSTSSGERIDTSTYRGCLLLVFIRGCEEKIVVPSSNPGLVSSLDARAFDQTPLLTPARRVPEHPRRGFVRRDRPRPAPQQRRRLPPPAPFPRARARRRALPPAPPARALLVPTLSAARRCWRGPAPVAPRVPSCAAVSAPGSSSKQKKMPPTAQTQSMTKDHIRTRRFLSKTDGGFPRVALLPR